MVYLGNRRIDAEFDDERKHYLINEDKVVSLINALEPKLGNLIAFFLSMLGKYADFLLSR